MKISRFRRRRSEFSFNSKYFYTGNENVGTCMALVTIGMTSSNLSGNKRPLLDSSARARHPPCHAESDSGSSNNPTEECVLIW